MAKSKYKQIEERAGKPMPEVLKDTFAKHGTLTGVADELGISQGTVSLWLARLHLKLKSVLVEKDKERGCE